MNGAEVSVMLAYGDLARDKLRRSSSLYFGFSSPLLPKLFREIDIVHPEVRFGNNEVLNPSRLFIVVCLTAWTCSMHLWLIRIQSMSIRAHTPQSVNETNNSDLSTSLSAGYAQYSFRSDYNPLFIQGYLIGSNTEFSIRIFKDSTHPNPTESFQLSTTYTMLLLFPIVLSVFAKDDTLTAPLFSDLVGCCTFETLGGGNFMQAPL